MGCGKSPRESPQAWSQLRGRLKVLSDPLTITIDDPDHSANEQRYIDIGTSEKGRVLVVSYTERGGSIRIIICRKATQTNRDDMKKVSTTTNRGESNGMRAEYDFTNGVRGKHYRAMQAGYTVTIRQPDGTTVTQEVKPKEGAVILAPDVREHFPDSESVNAALRSIIRHIPKKRSSANEARRHATLSSQLKSAGKKHSQATFPGRAGGPGAGG